jgi:hypothetical protein
VERRADLAYAAGLGLGIVFIVFFGPLERRIDLVHINDFSGFWAGARAVLLGIDPYDSARWRETSLALGTQVPDTAVYGYFPWVAIVLVPLALLPLETAAWIWTLSTVALAAIALRALLRAYLPGRPIEHGVFGASLLVAQPGFHSLVLGQWSFALLASLAGAALALRSGRRGAAAVLALVLMAKPQLFVFSAVRLARPGVLRIALPAAVALIVVSTLVLPHWIVAWTNDVAPARLGRNATLPIALGDLAGPAGVIAGYVLIGIGVIVATRFGVRDEASLAVWLALSSAGALYEWSYDHLVLLVPIVIAAGVLAAGRRRSARLVALGGAGILLLISPVMYGLAVTRHRESFSAFIPVVVFALIVGTLWSLRRSGDVSSSTGACSTTSS